MKNYKVNKKQLVKKQGKRNLCFATIGGYIQTSMQQKNNFGLVTASKIIGKKYS